MRLTGSKDLWSLHTQDIEKKKRKKEKGKKDKKEEEEENKKSLNFR